jgi:hypothetical protein
MSSTVPTLTTALAACTIGYADCADCAAQLGYADCPDGPHGRHGGLGRHMGPGPAVPSLA